MNEGINDRLLSGRIKTIWGAYGELVVRQLVREVMTEIKAKGERGELRVGEALGTEERCSATARAQASLLIHS